MAIVPNKDGGGIVGQGNVDRKLTTPNRKNAGTPLASLTPLYAGEIVEDTATGFLWYAIDLTTTGWVAVNLSI